MAKLNVQKYYTLSGKPKINCYRIILTKKQVEKAGITVDDELVIKIEDKRIIIEKK